MDKRYILTYLFDSNPATGAVNINSLGSEFSVDFDATLIIPEAAKNINIVVKNAVVWFVTPNITILNNKLRIRYGLTTYDIDIPVGLYDIDTLSTKINTTLNINSNGLVPIDLIELLPDFAENKIVIQFNYYDTDIDFTIDNSLGQILGFSSQILVGNKGPVGSGTPPEGPVPYYFQGDEFAKFNTTDYYLIKCSKLISRGLQFNGEYLGVLCRIDIRGNINTKLEYDPNQAPVIPAPGLRGTRLSSLTFQLVNQNNELVDTRGEYWSLVFEIHYDMPANAITESA